MLRKRAIRTSAAKRQSARHINGPRSAAWVLVSTVPIARGQAGTAGTAQARLSRAVKDSFRNMGED